MSLHHTEPTATIRELINNRLSGQVKRACYISWSWTVELFDGHEDLARQVLISLGLSPDPDDPERWKTQGYAKYDAQRAIDDDHFRHHVRALLQQI